VLLVVDSHFKLREVLLLTLIERDRRVPGFLSLSSIVQDAVVELVLVVDDEMVRTVREGDD
jgi:hypothetical protein